MSLPSGPAYGAPRRSKGGEPQESRQSGDGPADPSASRNPVTHSGWDVIPSKSERGGSATQSACPIGWGERSGGEKPREASTVRPLGVGCRTSSSRDRSPEVGRRLLVPPRYGFGGDNAMRARPPRGVPAAPRRKPRRVKPMGAPALRAPVGTMVYAAKGVAKPRTWHAAAVGTAATKAGPSPRDRAVGRTKPRRGSGVRSRRSRVGGMPRVSGGMPLKGTKAQGGPPTASAAGRRVGQHARWASKRRTGRAEPMSAPRPTRPSPRSAAKPHERPRRSPQGDLRNHPSP